MSNTDVQIPVDYEKEIRKRPYSRSYISALILVQDAINKFQKRSLEFHLELKPVQQFFQKWYKNTWKLKLFFKISKWLLGIKLKV